MMGRVSDIRSLTLPGALILGVLAVGAVLTPSAVRESFDQAGLPERPSALIKGQYTEAFEDLYSESLAAREAAVTLWGAIDYALFGVGRSGVVVGRDGWLFTEEEYRTPDRSKTNLNANLEFVSKVQSVLSEQGIGLLVTLVPAKASVYPSRLKVAAPSRRTDAYAAFVEGLEDRQVPYLDATSALVSASVDAPVFMARDTHWTPVGATVVAEAVRFEIAARISTEAKGYRRVDLPETMHRGDLTKFTPVGAARDWLGLGDEAVQAFEAEALEAELDASGLFGAPEIPVALVGTSYSAQEQWSFAASLRLALDADVLNLAEDGGGPVKPMATFLEDLPNMEAPPQIVIWEWPMRFVDTEYADALAE